MKTLVLISIILTSALMFGCKPSNIISQQSQIDIVPDTFEIPEDTFDNKIPDTFEPFDQSELETPKKDINPYANKTNSVVNKKSTSIPASNFIKLAEKTMLTEGKKIGSPCNFYLRRVLQLAGFSNASFLANDFDVYAKKHFTHYRSVDFKKDASGSEIARLKQHIWSYPERTPFILQWSRMGTTGHVAILERINDSLVIYQASIGKYTARRDQTTVNILLNGYNRRTLTVYSEFTK